MGAEMRRARVVWAVLLALLAGLCLPASALAAEEVTLKVSFTDKSIPYTGKADYPGYEWQCDGGVISDDDIVITMLTDCKKVGTHKVKFSLRKGCGYTCTPQTLSFKITGKGSQTITGCNLVLYPGGKLNLDAKSSTGSKLTYKSTDTSVAKVNSKGLVTGVNWGTCKIKVTAAATKNCSKASRYFKVEVKRPNPLKAKAKKKTVKVKASAVTSAKKTLASNVKIVKKGGKVTYANATKSGIAKKFKVNKKTGKVTISAGTPAGTYTIKIKVKSKATATYAAGSKTVKYKIKVK